MIGKEILAIEDSFEKQNCGEMACYPLSKDKLVCYAPNFLSVATIEELKSFCTEQRWNNSPIRGRDSDDGVAEHEIRTSESCPMIPAAQYLENPDFQRIRAEGKMPAIVREVDLSWEISQKAAKVVGADPKTVEPLQMVRYTSPHAQYQVHHDHGGYYGKTTEQRPWTILVFLDAPKSGGYTSFPKLDLKVFPRTGDALIWRNVLPESGDADPDMVHAGEPPTVGKKYALNIWIGDKTANLSSAHWGKAS